MGTNKHPSEWRFRYMKGQTPQKPHRSANMWIFIYLNLLLTTTSFSSVLSCEDLLIENMCYVLCCEIITMMLALMLKSFLYPWQGNKDVWTLFIIISLSQYVPYDWSILCNISLYSLLHEIVGVNWNLHPLFEPRNVINILPSSFSWSVL